MLAAPDQRDAQFALDSLHLIRADAMDLLLCELGNDTPMRVRGLYWLNERPHLMPFPEMIAHHSPRTVGEAVGTVVGAPERGGPTCGGTTRSDRLACAAAWKMYLEQAQSPRKE